MNLIKTKLISLIATCALILSFNNIVYAQELNVPGFSGSINTTITSGFSVRTSERNCELQDGWTASYTAAEIDGTNTQAALGGATAAQAFAAKDAATQNLILNPYDKNNAGCTLKAKTDSYGNVATDQINIGNVNSDDGNLNFNQGDVVDATQRFFTEISGITDSGYGVNLSLAGSVNPVLDITDPHFKKLNNKAERTLESDLSLLDAYITSSVDTANGYVDITAGRFVTNWGEATFIPVTMNGLVTNAVDLTKLRAPGSSIREALTPTEQISLNFDANGWGMEAYLQLQSDEVAIDPAGAFFGNEVAGPGGYQLLANGSNQMEGTLARSDACTWGAIMLQDLSCDATTLALHTATATRDDYSLKEIGRQAWINSSSTLWDEYTAKGRVQDFGSMVFLGAPSTYILSNALEKFSHASGTGSTLADSIYTASNIRAEDYLTKATVELRANNTKHVYAKDSGQFGLKASKYFDSFGSGLDLGFYFANYHSKVPYVRIVGKGGVLAGDHVGIYKTEVEDYKGPLASGGDGSALGHEGINSLLVAAGGTSDTLGSASVDMTTISDTLSGDDLSATRNFIAAANGAFGAGVCGGFTVLSGADTAVTTASAGNVTETGAKSVLQDLIYGVNIDGKIYHKPTNCMAAGNHDAATTHAYLGYGATLLPAITPLNYATYQFIYPEDNQIFGMSFNTNISGTTVQGEVAYRPNFPLATATGDQINQIGDRSGATAALTAFAIESYGTNTAKATAISTYKSIVDGVMGSGSFESLAINNRRSSLPFISVAPDTDYYSDAFIEYDVLSFDIGTTTSFSASHPITQSIGADSAVFLTELAAVNINDLNNKTNGFVARGGFNEGNGEHLCLGMFAYTDQATINAINESASSNATFLGALVDEEEVNIDYNLDAGSAKLTNLGASIVDALFGNGNYCEGQMGADDLSATYRLIGSATYNNVANSPWSVNPTFAFAHDFYGYGPSSLGGFVEDKASLSLGLNATKNNTTVNLNYVNQLGPDEANTRNDMDFISASVSYAF